MALADKGRTGATMVLEFLADAPNVAGGRVEPLPTDGNISALNIPHSSIVFDLHGETDVTAELLGNNGKATETIQYADLVSFTCLKAFAFDQRAERKDAHDLSYCLEHATGGIDAVIAEFEAALKTKHRAVITSALDILSVAFVMISWARAIAKTVQLPSRVSSPAATITTKPPEIVVSCASGRSATSFRS